MVLELFFTIVPTLRTMDGHSIRRTSRIFHISQAKERCSGELSGRVEGSVGGVIRRRSHRCAQWSAMLATRLGIHRTGIATLVAFTPLARVALREYSARL
jgi:hypothetical protein